MRNLPSERALHEDLERLPFAGRDRGGRVYHTLMIETPHYLQRLLRELLLSGVRIEQREFASQDDLAWLPAKALITP